MSDWLDALKTVAEEALENEECLTADDRLVWWCVFRLVGVGNACTSRELAEGLGWEGPSDDVKVRHCVERLVRAGLPVCSTRRRGGGYYLPASEAELLEAEAPIRSEAKERFARADALDLARVKILLTLDEHARRVDRPRAPRPEPAEQLNLV